MFQVRNRICRAGYEQSLAPRHTVCSLVAEPIPKFVSLDGEMFSFLNVSDCFRGWNFTDHGMLWAYNLNYFDYVNQPGMYPECAAAWIDRFIDDIDGSRVGLDPYPTALRCINWVKFFCRCPEHATAERETSAYSQLLLLSRKLEFHLLGNHLLEDAYSLYFCAAYFEDYQLLDRARKMLFAELKEQILADGAHYEQSAMYHCILLDRLLDCINMAKSKNFEVDVVELAEYATMMLGHLESITYENGDVPLMNDAAVGIAPHSAEIFGYARRLGLKWDAMEMKECGYRKLMAGKYESVIDVGEIAASYQPGHSHADVLNYELRMDGVPFVVDTGISTYDKTPRRQYERSSSAHNVVTVGGRDSAEVWGGFRIGYRYCCRETDDNTYEVSDYGCGLKVTRRFVMTERGFTIIDSVNRDDESVSRIHLAPGVEILSINDGEVVTNKGMIVVSGAGKVMIADGRASREYNHLENIKIVEIHFVGSISYTIS